MGTTQPFDFDRAVAEFFDEWPEYRARVFVPPPIPYEVRNDPKLKKQAEKQAEKLYREFCKTNGLDDSFKLAPAFYPSSAVVYAPRSGLINLGGTLPRWPIKNTAQDLNESFFNCKKLGLPSEKFNNLPFNIDMWNQFIFDHEIGHILTVEQYSRGGLSPDCRIELATENIADMYGVMRHYERYGAKSILPNFIPIWRSMNMVINEDRSHRTCYAVRHVIEMNDKGELNGLGKEDRINMIQKKAVVFLHEKETNLIYERNFNGLFDKPLNNETLARLTACAVDTIHPIIVKTVLTYLNMAEKYFPIDITSTFDFHTAREMIAARKPPRSLLMQKFNRARKVNKIIRKLAPTQRMAP